VPDPSGAGTSAAGEAAAAVITPSAPHAVPVLQVAPSAALVGQPSASIPLISQPAQDLSVPPRELGMRFSSRSFADGSHQGCANDGISRQHERLCLIHECAQKVDQAVSSGMMSLVAEAVAALVHLIRDME